MAKDIIKLLCHKEPDQRLGLLSFMELEYYSIEDAELDRCIAEVTTISN